MTEPLVSPEVDLRDFAYMPLDVVRLRDSDLAGNPDGEVFRAAVLSWCASWHQIPAASLPDDDTLLARLLGYGRDSKTWKRLRAAGALHKWVKCTDGRLYHPTVAEKANEAWTAKQAQRHRTEKARLARLSQPLSQNEISSVTENVTGSKGREERDKGKKGTSSLRSDVCSEPQTAAEPEAIEPEFLSPAFIAIETNKRGEMYVVSEAEVSEYSALYPGVDVPQALRAMCGWARASPAKRKTKSGMPRFINSWLAREQNSGNSRINGNGHGRKSAHAKAIEGAELWLRELEEKERHGGVDEAQLALPPK